MQEDDQTDLEQIQKLEHLRESYSSLQKSIHWNVLPFTGPPRRLPLILLILFTLVLIGVFLAVAISSKFHITTKNKLEVVGQASQQPYTVRAEVPLSLYRAITTKNRVVAGRIRGELISFIKAEESEGRYFVIFSSLVRPSPDEDAELDFGEIDIIKSIIFGSKR